MGDSSSGINIAKEQAGCGGGYLCHILYYPFCQVQACIHKETHSRLGSYLIDLRFRSNSNVANSINSRQHPSCIGQTILGVVAECLPYCFFLPVVSQKQKEFDNLLQIKPAEMTKPSSEDTEQTKAVKSQIAQIEADIQKFEHSLETSEKRISELIPEIEYLQQARKSIELLVQRITEVKAQYRDEFIRRQIDIETVIKFDIDYTKLDERIKTLSQESQNLQSQLKGENSCSEKIKTLQSQKKALEQKKRARPLDDVEV